MIRRVDAELRSLRHAADADDMRRRELLTQLADVLQLESATRRNRVQRARFLSLDHQRTYLRERDRESWPREAMMLAAGLPRTTRLVDL